jgi:hypothetical protein
MDMLRFRINQYVELYVEAVKVNPPFQQQIHLPRSEQVPVWDPFGIWDDIPFTTLSEKMVSLDPLFGTFLEAGKHKEEMRLFEYFTDLYFQARINLSSPPPHGW